MCELFSPPAYPSMYHRPASLLQTFSIHSKLTFKDICFAHNFPHICIGIYWYAVQTYNHFWNVMDSGWYLTYPPGMEITKHRSVANISFPTNIQHRNTSICANSFFAQLYLQNNVLCVIVSLWNITISSCDIIFCAISFVWAISLLSFFLQYRGSRFLSDGSARGWGYKRRLSHPSVGQSCPTQIFHLYFNRSPHQKYDTNTKGGCHMYTSFGRTDFSICAEFHISLQKILLSFCNENLKKSKAGLSDMI